MAEITVVLELIFGSNRATAFDMIFHFNKDNGRGKYSSFSFFSAAIMTIIGALICNDNKVML